jgi:small acid-soluble spore protein H (minor)
MDTERAKEIIQSTDNIEVLFDGTPVWLESVNTNNTADVTYIDTHKKQEVPVYKLVEVSPANNQ